jgi:quinolinate synthase
MPENLSQGKLVEEIARLKKQQNAVILAHYYQEADIQDVADFIGDSLELSRKAASTNADVIVFCGVKFMAEVAKILNPTKKVIIPDVNAGCSLEDSCPPLAFKAFREKHKNAISLTYINCSAEVKALSDVIVTSSNAEKIIRQIPLSTPIIFAPDKYLGKYLIKKTGRDMILWEGSCIVHEHFSLKALVKLKARHKKAIVIAHPECPEPLLEQADHIGSTSSLLNFVKENNGKEFIVLTEPGIIHQMKRFSPNAVFYTVPDEGGKNEDGSCGLCNECPFMKLNTLEKLYLAMKNGFPELILSEDLRLKAEKPLRKMLEMSR